MKGIVKFYEVDISSTFIEKVEDAHGLPATTLPPDFWNYQGTIHNMTFDFIASKVPGVGNPEWILDAQAGTSTLHYDWSGVGLLDRIILEDKIKNECKKNLYCFCGFINIECL